MNPAAESSFAIIFAVLYKDRTVVVYVDQEDYDLFFVDYLRYYLKVEYGFNIGYDGEGTWFNIAYIQKVSDLMIQYGYISVDEYDELMRVFNKNCDIPLTKEEDQCPFEIVPIEAQKRRDQ